MNLLATLDAIRHRLHELDQLAQAAGVAGQLVLLGGAALLLA